MQVSIVFCLLVAGAYCAPMLDEKLGNMWSLFKRVHKKQYNSVDDETSR